MLLHKVLLAVGLFPGTFGFMIPESQRSRQVYRQTMLQASSLHVGSNEFTNDNISDIRRQILTIPFLSIATIVTKPDPSLAAGSFTPGGTLVDREIGVTVGNPEASLSRKVNNENVLFAQDNYFKFGVAAKWIEPDATDFPKTMPFVLSQQRYDSLKKYGDRVKSGAIALNNLDGVIKDGRYSQIAPCDDPSYALRPLGLLANSFLASENTGATNELLLARWYINEIYLRIGDIQNSQSIEEALNAHKAAKKAMNSYLSLLNRVITPKVGNKFEYIVS
jgi:hypothetical protein